MAVLAKTPEPCFDWEIRRNMATLHGTRAEKVPGSPEQLNLEQNCITTCHQYLHPSDQKLLSSS